MFFMFTYANFFCLHLSRGIGETLDEKLCKYDSMCQYCRAVIQGVSIHSVFIEVLVFSKVCFYGYVCVDSSWTLLVVCSFTT